MNDLIALMRKHPNVSFILTYHGRLTLEIASPTCRTGVSNSIDTPTPKSEFNTIVLEFQRLLKELNHGNDKV